MITLFVGGWLVMKIGAIMLSAIYVSLSSLVLIRIKSLKGFT